MEILKMLKEEIKKMASEENINLVKLNEYTRIYERIKAYDALTVDQAISAIGGQNYMCEPQIAIPRMGVVAPRDAEIGNLFDMIKEVACEVNNKPKRSEIDEYIWWIGFIKNLKKDLKSYPMTDKLEELWDKEINNLSYNLYRRIFTLMKRQLDKDIEKEVLEMEGNTKKIEKIIVGEPRNKSDDTSDASMEYHENNSSGGI
ncbi:MAG: hypothetical protein ABSF14_24405 [Terriglobia bacterium]|jgi:hypothetical protein